MPQPALSTEPSTLQAAPMPPNLANAFKALARQNGRSASDELRRAMHFWLIVAGVAAHHDADAVEALEPAIRDGRLHDFRLAAINHVGDAFQHAAPEAVLESLARESDTATDPAPDNVRGVGQPPQQRRAAPRPMARLSKSKGTAPT